jgi:hypothetical protein
VTPSEDLEAHLRELERSLIAIEDLWKSETPPPRTAMISWLQYATALIRRILTGTFTNQEAPTAPAKRPTGAMKAVEQSARIARRVLDEARAKAGLDDERTEEVPGAPPEAPKRQAPSGGNH